MQRLFWFLLLATVVWGTVMQVEMTGYVQQPSRLGTDLPSSCKKSKAPVIAQLELSRDPLCFASLIAPVGDTTDDARADRDTNIKVARLNTRADFLFIVLYWLTFLAFARLLCATAGRRRLGVAVAILITVAAGLDVRENQLLLGGFEHVAAGSLDFVTSGVVSTAKWCVFGFATIFLGDLCFVAERLRLREVIGALLMGAGLVTVVCTLAFANPQTGFWVLIVALLLALISYFPWNLQGGAVARFVIYAYLLRFPILNGLLLAAVLPAGYFYAPSIFYGLFDAIAPFSFFLICFASLLLSLIIMITARITLAYAPDRFPDLSGARPWLQTSWRPTILFSLLAVPMVAMTWVGSASDGFPAWWKPVDVVLAMASAVLFLYLTAQLHAWLEDTGGTTVCFVYPPFPGIKAHGQPNAFSAKAAQAINAVLPAKLVDGYVRPQNGGAQPVLRSGHRVSAIAFLVTLAFYGFVGIYTAPNKTHESPAAMFYVLLLLCLLAWFFAGVAFFLDKLRVPVLTAVLAASMVLALAGGTDHVFRLHEMSSSVSLLSPGAVIERWEAFRQRGDKPIVVVATAGGGIRASAWTARVLTGLTRECGSNDPTLNEFTSSVVLISSVSGGSEGAMYFAGWYDQDGKIDPNKRRAIFKESAETDLGAVGWGLVYPDLMRTVPGPNLLPLLSESSERIDRGLALEREWVRHWTTISGRPLLSEWAADVARGSRPAVIFNGTVSETGNRFIAGTTDLFASPTDAQEGTLQFFRAFDKEDINVSTAARLSATFPFVSPMSRPDTDRKYGQVHIGDGGYYDNSGILSALQWLMNAGKDLQGRKVYLVIIDSRSKEKAEGGVWSWQRQMVAPIGTLLSVRTSSQQTRTDVELNAVTEALGLGDPTVASRIIPVYFHYPESESAPLSWHLLMSQKHDIVKAWRNRGQIDGESSMLKDIGCATEPGAAVK